MHEYSIARSILETVLAVRNERRLGLIQRVVIELGEFSGVEPLQLESAYADLSPEILGHRSEIQIQTVPLRGQCSHCLCEFHIEDFRFQCPACSCRDVQIVSGEELRILSVCTQQNESEPCLPTSR